MAAGPDFEMLDAVFGPGESDDPWLRAESSDRLFVRGLNLLTVDHSRAATGHRLTAWEALDAYGLEALCEVAVEGSAIITANRAAAGRVIRERRAQLNLPAAMVARMADVPVRVFEALENSDRRPVQEYERVARVLGLDDRMVSFRSTPEGNNRLAVRLRTVADDNPELSPSSVLALSEASWVATTQVRLEEQLGLRESLPSFTSSSDYGIGRPAYQPGYELADHTREVLGLGDDPIQSMRELVEERLRIPLIQTNLDARIAGATIETDGVRAIILNLVGRNADALVRRSTMAHELAHLLYDPSQRLDDLRVDEYSEIERNAQQRTDPVEQRANAFSVQLLAPQAAVIDRFGANPDLFESVLDYFGISFTAGRYQLWNGLHAAETLESLGKPRPEGPEADWEARETYTILYHPIRSLADHPSRAGRFSAVVYRAATLRVISWATAADWLFSTPEELQSVDVWMRDLYGDVFET